MSILIAVIGGIAVLCFLVAIHEAGHYLASRAFGVRVTEFMIGLPGPCVGFTKGRTKFGVTAVPLGGYARVCGMEGGPVRPHVKEAMAALYRRGTATMEDIAADCGISDDEAYEALEQLSEWGSCSGPSRKDKYNTYRAPEIKPTGRELKKAAATGQEPPRPYALGEARAVEDEDALYEEEYRQQYRAQPFWKRAIILVAGVAVNLLFAMLAFIVVYSVIGIDYQTQAGEIVHLNATPLQAVQIGFGYIGMVVQMIAGLFNPQTAAETVSNSSSVVGIVVMSREFFEQGLVETLFFMAAISVSLGIMNLIPIPPLDGGRLVVEIFQKISKRSVSQRAMGYISAAGMVLFIGFFIIMLNQDIQRLIAGYWS